MFEGDPQGLRSAVNEAREDVASVALYAVREGHYDLASSLYSIVRQLQAWSQQLTYDALENEEQLRSQLKFLGHGLADPTEPPDLPF